MIIYIEYLIYQAQFDLIYEHWNITTNVLHSVKIIEIIWNFPSDG